MIVFKTFFKILKKYKLVIAIYAGIFLIIMVFNSSSDTSVGNTFSGESISFTVINRDGSYIGDAIKEYLSKGNNFKEKKDDIKSLRNDLFYRDIYYVLIVIHYMLLIHRQKKINKMLLLLWKLMKY